MTKVTKEDILKLAALAKLKLSEAEVKQFALEFSQILAYVEQLQKVDVGDLKPTYQVTGLSDVMRPDEVRSYTASPAELLKNAPAVEDGQIKVKRVL